MARKAVAPPSPPPPRTQRGQNDTSWQTCTPANRETKKPPPKSSTCKPHPGATQNRKKNEISEGKTATNQVRPRKQRGKREQRLEGFRCADIKEKNVESSKARGGKVRRRGMLERGGRGYRRPKPKQRTGG
ncbi:hypothetical protein DVH24_015504 [Malus domestica]|uniref:Uncharacterized protein n=1 Tax=Malus domestica TaxID=3750 RepID=A0A498HLU7_MALDO|nr:hypothetical protein DVH24_015504 [Malus domestica]